MRDLVKAQVGEVRELLAEIEKHLEECKRLGRRQAAKLAGDLAATQTRLGKLAEPEFWDGR